MNAAKASKDMSPLRERMLRMLLPILVLAAGVVLWHELVRLYDIAPYVLPGPLLVGATLIRDWAVLSGSLLATLATTIEGFLLAALGGIGLAILGRAYVGRTWTMPTANEENPELVTTGPYAFVRHPIYGGMLLAMLGSAIGQSVLWLLPLIVYGPHFIVSARREERLLLEQFPQHYRAYMKGTKMLLPFVF